MFVILKGKTHAPIGKFKAVHTQQKRIKIFVRTALPVSKPFDFIQHFGIIFFIYVGLQINGNIIMKMIMKLMIFLVIFL